MEEALKNAPRDESEGLGINFQEVSNRGSGAMCAGLLLALVTFEGEKQKGPLGDFKLRDSQNSQNVLFLNGAKAGMGFVFLRDICPGVILQKKNTDCLYLAEGNMP